MPTSICTIRFQICAILFAFRRGVGLPLPLHQSLLFSLIFVKEHLSLALLAPPVAPNTAIPTQPLQKNNNPSPRTTTLASLVKGEVLSPDKIRATTGGIATPPSSPRTNHSKTALSHSLFVMPTSVCADMLSHPHYPIRFS